MNEAESIINKVLSNTISAIKNFEEDSIKFPLFEWKLDSGGFELEIVNDSIHSFFYLLLDCQNYEIYPFTTGIDDIEEDEYASLVDNFFSDVKMSVLNDALNNLIDHFRLKREYKKYPNILKEIFFSFDSFEKQIKEYSLSFDFLNTENLINVINVNRDTIHLKVPKILFPWYAYALMFTHKYLSSKKINIANKKYLSLKWSRSDYPNEENLFINGQKSFQAFINSLRVNHSSVSAKYNRSLNLYLFNETTNLYDIYNVVNTFGEDSAYMEFQAFIGESIDEMNKYERYKKKQTIFAGVSKLAKLNNLGVKTLLINEYYSKTLFENEEVWTTFNQIFDNCKNTLVNDIKEKYLPIFPQPLENVPKEILIEFAIYNLFSKEEPFEEFIGNALEEGIPVYSPSSDDLEMHLYEAYAYAYKSFYQGTKSNTKKK
ncbi:hypothetical protein [Lysinibacillus sp. NPDC093216]|uniref:hypothetical protein n=1 Tax=Lysinibacillus sp. NPDC093216 TaxID=3390576 RepID=UPI003D06CB2F